VYQPWDGVLRVFAFLCSWRGFLLFIISFSGFSGDYKRVRHSIRSKQNIIGGGRGGHHKYLLLLSYLYIVFFFDSFRFYFVFPFYTLFCCFHALVISPVVSFVLGILYLSLGSFVGW
jgi:hypothetical protein